MFPGLGGGTGFSAAAAFVPELAEDMVEPAGSVELLALGLGGAAGAALLDSIAEEELFDTVASDATEGDGEGIFSGIAARLESIVGLFHCLSFVTLHKENTENKQIINKYS
jgi:hypothetical protein